VNDVIVLENKIISCGEDKCILWDLTPKKEDPLDLKANKQLNKIKMPKPKTT